MEFQVDTIDKVIKNAVQVMENSKYQIFEICETARSESASLKSELQETMEQLNATIDQVDQLENDFRRARVRLSEVSRDFRKYKEEDIKVAYEQATRLQTDVTLHRQKEVHLKARRDDLQKRIRNVEQNIERAEALGSQLNVVHEYLSGDLNQVTRILESAKNRQQLGLKIILAQEEERKRIAREIHDGAAQSLANVVLRAEIAERMVTRQEYPQVKHEINDLKGQVRAGLEEIRKIIFNLRPMALDDLGLIPTLRKFVQDFEEKTQIRTSFDTIGIESRLPSAMEVAIFRLVQEAFSNVVKHAEATYLSLEITFQKQMVKISIKDNGIGFNLGSIESKLKSAEHFGIIGMRERVELLEGRFEIQSDTDKGTKIDLLIPINVENGKE
jgi:two-component system sensor histidine kinase DegS